MTPLRTDSFVPLTPALPSGERQDFRVTVLSGAANTQAFEPVHARASSQPGAAPPAPHTPACGPRISVQREGDRVSSIQIQCSCGQTIDLACIYQELPKNA